MSTTTTNYGLIKPDTTDPILIGQLNDNSDAIDAALKENADALGGKVDKETGKGLSTNDFTTAEKTKLAGIAEGAEVNEIEGIKVNNTSVNPDANKVVNITVPTTAADVSALPDTTKYAVALSLTINSSTFVMTGQLKDQNGDNLGTAQTIDLPLESVVVGGSYNSQTKKVVLTLQNGNTIEFSVADLVSGLQTELSASNKLNPAYIDYDSTYAAVTEAQREQIETNKNNILSTYTSTPYTCTAIDTYEYTGISITCNANQLLEAWIIDEKGNSTALGIIVSDSNASIAAEGSIVAENNTTYTSADAALWARELHCVLPPKKRSSSKTFYVWVKRAGTTSNNIQVITRPIVINQ